MNWLTDLSVHYFTSALPSVLWCCWLGGRKGIQPVKPEWWDAGMVMCLGQGSDLHMTQLMPLPLTISCSSKYRLVLPFWCRLTQVVMDKIQEGLKRLCVCLRASVHVCMRVLYIRNCAKYCCHLVCMSVCLLTYYTNHMLKLHKIFCACYLWPWLGYLTTTDCIHFCRWQWVYTWWGLHT